MQLTTAPSLSPETFAAAMAALGPFEPSPHLAVALSGGGDSMALALLADAWARERGGKITALTVDHRLRPESAQEAAQAAGWMATRGVAHHTLAWEGGKPRSNRMEAAREARYRLLGEWCRAQGVLHLLVAHTQEDQAETYLDRLSRGSGARGLSGMAAEVFWPFGRVIRPLLSSARRAAREYLKSEEQPWLEDPTNTDPRYKRTRLRAALENPEAFAAVARHNAAARREEERASARLWAQCAACYPEGYATLLSSSFLCAPEAAARLLLSQLIACIGGGKTPPRAKDLLRLQEGMRAGGFRSRTLGGCVIALARDRFWIRREHAHIPPITLWSGDAPLLWDGRFLLSPLSSTPQALEIRPLGTTLSQVMKQWPAAFRGRAKVIIPKPVLRTLPGIWKAESGLGLEGSVSIPHVLTREDTSPAALFLPQSRMALPWFSQ